MSIPDSIVQAIEKWAKQREDAAYQRGWADATAALVAAAARTAATSPQQERHRERLLAPTPDVALIAELANGTNRERVTFALRARPGMRASEVPAALTGMGLEVNEQSILTTIKRMRTTGEIEKRGSELYLRGRRAA